MLTNAEYKVYKLKIVLIANILKNKFGEIFFVRTDVLYINYVYILIISSEK